MSHFEINSVLADITKQCRRHKRQSNKTSDCADNTLRAESDASTRVTLVNDLEIVERKVLELRGLLPPCVSPNGSVDGCMSYVRREGNKSFCAFCGKEG